MPQAGRPVSADPLTDGTRPASGPGVDAGADRARRAFLVLFVVVMALKVLVAVRLPVFVDEAFYWLEGQRLAPAYSDLPGLTAWLARLGVALAGNSEFGLRLPFLLIGAAVPWLVARITAREFGAVHAWQAGSLALLLPLAGTLGLMALPDAAMALATLLCMDAGAKLLRRVDAAASLELALGLVIGALSHYRFIAVIGVGFIALLLLADGRRALRDVRVLTAIAIGAAAWTPLVWWNLDNADAGLRFQLVDRHPWAFHLEGLWFVLVQALMVTPLLFAVLLAAGWRARGSALPAARYFALLGLLVVAGFFGLGFFADTERVSFHWPFPGYLALLPLAPALLGRWPRWLRLATWAMAAAGLLAVLSYYVAVSIPDVRARSAAEKWYPSNFAGWDELAAEVRRELALMPEGTRLVAGSFKIGAELGFSLGDASIPVLDHPLNHKHGRAPQLRLWGLEAPDHPGQGEGPVLLVEAASDVPYKDLLARYRHMCSMVGPLPPPKVLNIDHGSQRFLLFRLQRPAPADAECVTPAMSWIDAPEPRGRVGRQFTVNGWAFKDGVGLERVEVLLDGMPVAEAGYGLPAPHVASYWRISGDPNHPDVGFRAEVELDAGVVPGRHWLGLRLHGADGSMEDSPEQPVELR